MWISIKQDVFEKDWCPRGQQSQKRPPFSVTVKVKVTMSMSSVSFERATLVEYTKQIWIFISYSSKVIAKVKVDNRQTNRQDKNSMPPIIPSGGIKYF